MEEVLVKLKQKWDKRTGQTTLIPLAIGFAANWMSSRNQLYAVQSMPSILKTEFVFHGVNGSGTHTQILHLKHDRSTNNKYLYSQNAVIFLSVA